MDDGKKGLAQLAKAMGQDGVDGSAGEGRRKHQAGEGEQARVRAARAKVIEETTYRLTDLLTIISGRIEILGEKVPVHCREELLAIREEVKKGVELNKRFFQVAKACEREMEK